MKVDSIDILLNAKLMRKCLKKKVSTKDILDVFYDEIKLWRTIPNYGNGAGVGAIGVVLGGVLDKCILKKYRKSK